MWNTAYNTVIQTLQDAHAGFVRGLSITPDGERFISCSDDKAVKIWSLPDDGHIQVNLARGGKADWSGGYEEGEANDFVAKVII